MSHIIVPTHQLLGASMHISPNAQQSLKQCYLAKKIAKISRLHDAYVSVFEKKALEITAITAQIDALLALPSLTLSQKRQLNAAVKERSTVEKWLLSSRLMKHIHELRAELDALSDNALDTYQTDY